MDLVSLYVNKREKGTETVEKMCISSKEQRLLEKNLYDEKEEEQGQRKKVEWRDR